MRYIVRKGLESPCKIRGFLSSDYWLLIGILGAFIVLFILGIRSGIMSGDWNICLVSIIGAITVVPIVVRKFRKNARSKKFDEIKQELTVSNFLLNKIIRKHENRRGL